MSTGSVPVGRAMTAMDTALERFSLAAMMDALPVLTPNTSALSPPVETMAATDGSELDQVIVRPLRGFPEASSGVACTPIRSPTTMLEADCVTAIDETSG